MTSLPKKHYSCLYVFFGCSIFFGVTNSIAVFRNRPRHLYISNALSSWRMEGPHEGVRDHEETTETRETRSSLPPTPPGHKPGHFFLVFSPSEKNRVSQRKNMKKRLPTKFSTFAMHWDSMPTETIIWVWLFDSPPQHHGGCNDQSSDPKLL